MIKCLANVLIHHHISLKTPVCSYIHAVLIVTLVLFFHFLLLSNSSYCVRSSQVYVHKLLFVRVQNFLIIGKFNDASK